MKEIKREVTRTETIGYEAIDGTFFHSKEECEKYDGTAKAVITAAYKKLIKKRFYEDCISYICGCDYVYHEISVPQNADEIETINKYLHIYHVGLIDTSYIGKAIDITGSEEDDALYGIALLEDELKELTKFFTLTEEN